MNKKKKKKLKKQKIHYNSTQIPDRRICNIPKNLDNKYFTAQILVKTTDEIPGPLTQKALEILKIYRQCIIDKNFLPDDLIIARAIVGYWSCLTEDPSLDLLDLDEIFCCNLNDEEIKDFINDTQSKYNN